MIPFIPMAVRAATARHLSPPTPPGPARSGITTIVVLTRQRLRDLDACAEGMALFDAIAPSGVWRGEWAPLHGLWLAVAYPAFASSARTSTARASTARTSAARTSAARASAGAGLDGAGLDGCLWPAAHEPPAGWARDASGLRRVA